MTPEQKARKLIDGQLQQTGWAVQSADEMDISAARGVAVREFALETGFAAELQSGRLEWRSVNYEQPGNEHFAADYNLAAPSLVLVSMRDGKQAAWRGLPEVWEHVGDKPALVEFVKKNVQEFLDNAAPAGGRRESN